MRSVAFPAISCGVYGYPVRQAARIAVRECGAFLEAHPAMDVTFALFSGEDLVIYRRLLDEDRA
jgi:O-acetyl-ADP-ribose deacetylase (regulator of RNase III)